MVLAWQKGYSMYVKLLRRVDVGANSLHIRFYYEWLQKANCTLLWLSIATTAAKQIGMPLWLLPWQNEMQEVVHCISVPSAFQTKNVKLFRLKCYNSSGSKGCKKRYKILCGWQNERIWKCRKITRTVFKEKGDLNNANWFLHATQKLSRIPLSRKATVIAM